MRWLPCGKGTTWYTMMGPQTKPTWMPSKRYIRCHARPCQEALWNQDADVISSSTIPTAGEAASSSISIPKATAEAASSSTTAKACSPKAGAKGSCASPANARPGGAHDYMYGVLQGTGPIVLFHFMSAMEEILHIYQFLEGYVAHWVCPRSWKSQHIGSHFSKKK